MFIKTCSHNKDNKSKMEKRLNTKVEEYVKAFKDEICGKITSLNFDEKSKVADLMQHVYDFNRLTLQKDDFIKRKRVKNSIPEMNRCVAKRASGEQCTRRRKSDCEFCGTHSKGTPHGLIQEENSVLSQVRQKMEVFAEDVKGIVYYMDMHGNVYKTEDILEEKENPLVIAKWVKQGDTYTIPEFGLV